MNRQKLSDWDALVAWVHQDVYDSKGRLVWRLGSTPESRGEEAEPTPPPPRKPLPPVELVGSHCPDCEMKWFRCVCKPYRGPKRAPKVKPQVAITAVAARGSYACGGCYELDNGVKIHPPRTGYDQAELIALDRKRAAKP